MSMTMRAFGQSQLRATPLGLGLAALGRPGYINLGHAADLGSRYEVAAMEAQAHAVLTAAWESGLRYFDVARSYGRAEQFLASWLVQNNIRTDEVVVGSKWGYTYTAAWQITAEEHEVKEHSLAVFQQQKQETWAILGEYLNIYHIHSATLDSGVLDNTAVLNALANLRQENIVVGLSLSGPQQGATLNRALEIEYDGVPLFGSVQATWNLLERSAEPALQAAHDAGWGVIVKEAVANGRLTPKEANPLLTPAAEATGVGSDALAMAAVLARPWASVVLSGAATVAHLQANVQATAVRWTPTLEAQLAPLTEPAEQYWQTRSDLAWN